MHTRLCPKCKQIKDLQEFRSGKTLIGYCRPCWNTYQKEMYHLHRQAGQTGTCPICLTKIRLVLDHRAGHVRGYICRSCNTGLAMFKDSIPNLIKAIEYLSKTVG